MRESFLHRMEATVIAGALFLGMVVLWLFFYRLGCSWVGRRSAVELGPIDDFVGILIALILAFGLALAYERFEAHARALVNDGSAIASCDITCDLLKEPHRQQCHSVLHRYARLRVDMFDVPLNELEPQIRESEKLHGELWQEVRAAVAEADTPSTALVVSAVRGVLDAHDARIVSRAQVVPGPMVVIILLLCLFWAAFSGYSYGLKSNRRRYAWVGFALAVAAVVYLILDLDRPTRGFIQVRQAQGILMEQIRSMNLEAQAQ